MCVQTYACSYTNHKTESYIVIVSFFFTAAFMYNIRAQYTCADHKYTVGSLAQARRKITNQAITQPVLFLFFLFSFLFTSRTQTGARYDVCVFFPLRLRNPAAVVPVTKEFQLRVRVQGAKRVRCDHGETPSRSIPRCVYVYTYYYYIRLCACVRVVSKITDILHFTNCVTRTHTHVYSTASIAYNTITHRDSGVCVRARSNTILCMVIESRILESCDSR